MFFTRKKRRLAELEKSFGQIKTEGFNFDYIGRYFSKKENGDAFQIISNQTCEDLDFDLFFRFIDRTTSKVGQQYLYNELRAVNINSSKTESREKVIQYLQSNPDKRKEIQHLLSKLNTSKAYFIPDLFQKELNEKPKWFFIVPLLSFFAFLTAFLSFFNSSYAIFLFVLFPIHVFFHYALKLKVNLIIDSIPQLLTLNYISKKIIKDNYIASFFEDRKSSIQKIDKIKSRFFIFKSERTFADDMNVIKLFILENIRILFLIEPILSFSAADKVKNHVKEIEDVFSFVGELEIILTILSIRESVKQFCIPEIKPLLKSIKAGNLFHPLLENAVANSFESGEKSFLLTGSNMSGKTTFIRSIGLSSLSGMVLNTCFAESFSFPMIKIHSAIRISDDISSASSYFLKEVETMKVIIEESDKEQNNLFLLDELFKGTNTIERISSAKAILSYVNKSTNFVFVSTHDIELTTLLQDDYELYYFGEKITKGEINFDYTLKKGVPISGNAIKILEMKNFPTVIIEQANELVDEFTRNKNQ